MPTLFKAPARLEPARGTAQQEAPVDAPKSSAPCLPDHELIRLDAAAHPERTPSEHEAAAREIAGKTYLEDLRRISPAAMVTLSRELEADDLGL